MIKEIMGLIGFILKTILKLLGYVVKGTIWYLSNLSDIFKSYPKKGSSKVHIKEEIL